MKNYWLYLLVMASVTYLIRAIPLLLFKEKIQNKYVLSFLHYIPYAVLSAMTIPACFFATNSIVSAICGFIVALVLSYKDQSLLKVAFGAVVVVFITELFLK